MAKKNTQFEPIQITCAKGTDTGRMREHNEDYVDAFSPSDPAQRQHKGHLFIVADGMGGHQAGEVASRGAVRVISREYYADPDPDVRDSLARAIQKANVSIHQQAQQTVSRMGMGTTIVAAVVRGQELYLANVGDSRAYIMRLGDISKITRDHSLVEEQVRAGIITREEARRHPQRNVITRAIGSRPDVQVDTYSDELQPGDTLLLCSDGLSEHVPEEDILKVLNQYPPKEAVPRLIALANKRGGSDNISVLVVQAETPADVAPPQPAKPVARPAAAPARNGASSPLIASIAAVVLIAVLVLVALTILVPKLLGGRETPALPTATATALLLISTPRSELTTTPATDFTSIPPTPLPQPFFEGPFTYGTSFGGRPLLAYRLGTGPSVHAIIGGIHGGYEWNTVALVRKMLKYLQENPALMPDGVTLYVIPCANPDGYAAGTDREHGRMNGNGVDLNRNWDYHWQPTATHGTRPVSAGAYPFSEPETAALRDFILQRDVEAAIFYQSAMARVFYGAERDRSATYELAVVVSQATGYPTAAGVPNQITTGDAIDWMSAQGLAGVEVELTTHEDIEWERNLQGLIAFLNWTPPPSPSAGRPDSPEGRMMTDSEDGEGMPMSRKDDLEHLIRDSYDLIRQYGEIVQTSDRPKEKARARRNIEEQWGLVMRRKKPGFSKKTWFLSSQKRNSSPPTTPTLPSTVSSSGWTACGHGGALSSPWTSSS